MKIFTDQADEASAESDSNAGSNLSNLDDEVGLSSGNDASSELGNDAGAGSDNEVGSASDDEAMEVSENEEMTGNTHVTHVKSLNPIDSLVNIAKDTTDLLNSDKEDQPKGKKRRRKKGTGQPRKKQYVRHGGCSNIRLAGIADHAPVHP
ncbi:hypothetical protein MMC31_000748 [Peltigera leucophlebia]|nr:hypothetical protein [Peltigera leucophlebia]